MSIFLALLLGIVQGVSEFLPISSSAHLKLIKIFFNLDDINSFYLFDLFCHLGTIGASIYFLKDEIIKIFKSEKQKSYLIAIAILPLFPMYFFFKNIREFFSKSEFLGLFLIITSIFLFLITKINIEKKDETSLKGKIKDVLFIGLMQALALIPGISRSASTIFAAHFRGWKMTEAIRFSFLLAIPTVMGGSFLESLKLIFKKDIVLPSISPLAYLVGFISSFIVGFFAIRFIFSIFDKNKFRPFAWYLLIVGVISSIYINFVK